MRICKSLFTYTVPVFCAAALQAGGQHQACTVEVQTPQSGEAVSMATRVEGLAAIPPGAFLWILAHPKGDPLWWPKGGKAAVVFEGKWAVTAILGQSPVPVREIEIAAAVVDADTNQDLADWRKQTQDTGNYPGISFPATVPACQVQKVAVTLVSSPAPAASLQAQAYRVGIDPRVELMSIIFRLAGNNEYTQCRIPAYDRAIDSHFAAFRDHPAVKLARTLHATDSVGFDAVMNMAVNISDVETLAERVPFNSPESKLEGRWHGVKARKFLEEVRKFVSDSDFKGFLKSQQPLYDLTNTRLRGYVEKNADLEWFNRFFGSQANARFIVVAGLANGGSSYSASITPADGIKEIYAIPGVWTTDAEGQPTFGGGRTPTLVHEFVHSYANPLIDRRAAALRQAGERLFKATETQMRRSAYGAGYAVLCESLVRASTARYILAHQGAEAAEGAVAQEKRNSFLWTGELFNLLGEYEKDRAQYPTLETFMPRIVTFFNDVSGRIDQPVPKQPVYDESKRPKVVSMTIADGARDVDPALKEIVVRFDRPMRKKSMSVVSLDIAVPKISSASFDDTGTVFTMMVSLEPEKEYAFGLNDADYDNFRSAEGVPLKPVPVRFRTRAAK